MSIKNRLFFCLLSILVNVTSLAKDRQAAIDLGLGYKATFGMIGVGGRYFLTDFIDVNASVGTDMDGTWLSLGAKQYASSGKLQCFTFGCSQLYFVGANLIRLNEGLRKVSGAEYQYSTGYAINFIVGAYEIYSSGFTLGTEVGSRLWIQRPSVGFRYGRFLEEDKTYLENAFNNTPSLGCTFGWMF